MADARKTLEILLRGRDDTRSAYRSATAGARSFADQTIGQVSRVSRSVLNLQNMIAGAAVTMAVKTIMEPAIDMDKVETQLGVLFRSTDEGKRKIGELIDFAAKTPLQFGTLKDALGELKGAQLANEELIPSMRMLGDVAMGDAQKFGRLAHAYANIKNKGRATMEELNPLLEAGVPILDELRKRFGDISGPAMAKLIQSGKVGFGDVRAALQQLTVEGGMFHNMMEKVSETVAGKLSTLKDVGKLALVDIGTEALDEAGEAIDDLISTITELRESGELRDWGKNLGEAITYVHDRVAGLAEFVAENKRMLKTLGFTLATVSVLRSITKAARGVQLAVTLMAAAKKTETIAEAENTTATVANTGAKGANTLATKAQAAAAMDLKVALGSVKGALGTVAAAGAAAFAGWKIGNAIGDLIGLKDSLGDIAENRARQGKRTDWKFWEKPAEAPKTEAELFDEQWEARAKRRGWKDGRDDEGRTKSEAWRDLQRRGRKMRVAAETAEADKPEDTVDPPQAEDAETEQKGREQAAKALQQGAEREIKRRQEIAKRIEKAKDDIEDAKEKAAEDRQRKELQGQEKLVRDAIQAAEKGAREEERRARQLERNAKEAWERHLLPKDERKRQDKEAKDRAKLEERLHRRIERGRQRLAEGGRIRTETRELIEIDDQRKEAAAARAGAQEKRDFAEASRQRLATVQAQLAALTATQIGSEQELTKALNDLQAELRESSGDLGGRDIGGLTDEQLRSILGHGRKITEGTDEAKAERSTESDLVAEALGDVEIRTKQTVEGEQPEAKPDEERTIGTSVITEGEQPEVKPDEERELTTSQVTEGQQADPEPGADRTITTTQEAEGEQPEAKPDEERKITTSQATEGEQPDALPDAERTITTRQLVEGEQPEAKPDEERTITTHQVVTGVQPQALADEERTIETRERVTREIVVTDPGVAEPADQTVDRGIDVTDQGVSTPDDQQLQRDVVLEDPGTETPADQTVDRSIDVTDQGVSTPDDQQLQ
ncbi:MAG: tape measure protein, partial [Lentisphaerae bacterium]|nr:tape measure protein [Lentisphaerota bacterium]